MITRATLDGQLTGLTSSSRPTWLLARTLSITSSASSISATSYVNQIPHRFVRFFLFFNCYFVFMMYCWNWSRTLFSFWFDSSCFVSFFLFNLICLISPLSSISLLDLIVVIVLWFVVEFEAEPISISGSSLEPVSSSRLCSYNLFFGLSALIGTRHRFLRNCLFMMYCRIWSRIYSFVLIDYSNYFLFFTIIYLAGFVIILICGYSWSKIECTNLFLSLGYLCSFSLHFDGDLNCGSMPEFDIGICIYSITGAVQKPALCLIPLIFRVARLTNCMSIWFLLIVEMLTNKISRSDFAIYLVSVIRLYRRPIS